MSAGGDGIIDFEPEKDTNTPIPPLLTFVPTRFQTGKSLPIANHKHVQDVRPQTCVLCGGVITGEFNLEHPLPQWLHNFAGDAGNVVAPAFKGEKAPSPTWRQLSLSSHKSCNSQFSTKIENPVISSFKRIVNGAVLTWKEMDLVFDWLDKVKASSAHMATALTGHEIQLGYSDIAFPNKRVGAFDRFAIFFRVSEYTESLDLWDCLATPFLTTPSAVALRVKDLIVIYVSDNFILSEAFGLGLHKLVYNSLPFIKGSGKFSSGFKIRECRIKQAKIIAQPMRRRLFNVGIREENNALQPNGDGKVFELKGTRWERVKSTEFSSLPVYPRPYSHMISCLEIVEWLMLCKRRNFGRDMNKEKFYMNSLSLLEEDQRGILKFFRDFPEKLSPDIQT